MAGQPCMEQNPLPPPPKKKKRKEKKKKKKEKNRFLWAMAAVKAAENHHEMT